MSEQSPSEMAGKGAAPAVPHSDWECSEVIDRMFFFLDKELDVADCGQIEQHLADCGPCLAKYNLERTVKSLVRRSCSEVAPDGLRDRVLLSIRAVQVRITED